MISKKIIKLVKVVKDKALTIDSKNPAFWNLSPEEKDSLILDYLPFTSSYEVITFRNVRSISADIVLRLGYAYAHGTKIVLINDKTNLHKTYQHKHAKPLLRYEWQDFNFSQAIPKSLAETSINNMLFIEYITEVAKKNNLLRFIPKEVWQHLDDYSKDRIEFCKKYNSPTLELLEKFYKLVQKDCLKHKVFFKSPNAKTYFESLAELDFEDACAKHRIADSDRLTPEQQAFLYANARFYDVQIPNFEWRINTRKTKDGYTEEPEQVVGGMSTYDWTKVIYDPRNENQLPAFARHNLIVKSCPSAKLEKDAYNTLMYLIKTLGDNALASGYHRCPECHKIYHETDGCPCGHCEPITFLDADNMFYGIANTYEDYDNTKDFYDLEEDYED